MIRNNLYVSMLKDNILQDYIDKMKNKSIFITGACGMIASCLIDYIMVMNEKGANIQIYALGRNVDKAQKRFSSYFDHPLFQFIQQDINNEITLNENVDYIIHAASNANPKAYATQPVETILGNFIGMNNVLSFAKNKGGRVMYVSSGEMYGSAADSIDGFTEEYSGYVDYHSPRSCYPSGKRSAEVLCQSYLDEYEVDCVIVRPCHIYGPTASISDGRVIPAFIRDGVNGNNITMKSKGSQIRSHCYVIDVVTAMLHVLIYGEKGEAYNISADESVYSIKEMTEMICDYCNIKIEFDLPNEEDQKGFSKVERAVLKNDKLKKLGWRSHYSLKEGLISTIDILRSINSF